MTVKDLQKDKLNILYEHNDGEHHIVCTYDISLWDDNNSKFIRFTKFPKDFNLPEPSKEEMEKKYPGSSRYGPEYQGRFEFFDLNGTVPDNRKLFGKSYLELMEADRDNVHHKIKDLEGNLRLPAKVEWMSPDKPGHLMVFDFRNGFEQNSTYFNGFYELLPQAQAWFNKIVLFAITGYWEPSFEHYLQAFNVGRVAIDEFNSGRNIYY